MSLGEYGSPCDFSDKPERSDNLPLKPLSIDIRDILVNDVLEIMLEVFYTTM